MDASTSKTERKTIRRPDLNTLFSINPDGSRNHIQPADVKGRWQRRKKLVFAVLMLLYILLPWTVIGGHPAILLDIPGRHAYLFGGSFTNRDFFLAFFLITGIGFLLFVLTSLWGRVWCGYACPQTVFLEGVFRRIERWIEGPRERRIRRNKGPWTRDKILRKGVKHALFVAFSLAISHVFLSYFIPVSELRHVLVSPPAEHLSAFLWVMAITAVLYFDFAWFREQTCLIICPYGRLQSVMIDADTIIIGYDQKRGEPRGKLGKAEGDCVDCYRCVAVCPTGIDIRNGLQMECIGCANCVDACDEIMRHVGRSPGLVRYDSQRGFGGTRRGLLRPRLFVYVLLGLLGLTVATFSMSRRTGFEASILRARGLPYTLLETEIRNLVTVHIQNKTDQPHEYTIEILPAASAPDGAPPRFQSVIAQSEVSLQPLAEIKVPVFITVGRRDYAGSFELSLRVRQTGSEEQRLLEVRFRGP